MSFNFRPHSTLDPHMPPSFELRTSGAGIPLDENWNERYCVLRDGFRPIYDQIYNFDVFDDDVFLVSYPKSGTTWMQEAAWLLLNDLDFKAAKDAILDERSIYLEQDGLYPERNLGKVKKAAELKRPRLIKCHFHAHAQPRQLWEKKAKIIYCARNAKDVMVSFFAMFKVVANFKDTLDKFIDFVIHDDVTYSPYWQHVLDFWKMRHEPQIFFVTYEDMKRDLGDVITKLNKFLEKPPLTESQMSELLKHLSFDSMKKNDKTNPTKGSKSFQKESRGDFNFMRRGIVGSYRDELSEDNQRKIDEWTKKCLRDQNVTEEDIFGSI